MIKNLHKISLGIFVLSEEIDNLSFLALTICQYIIINFQGMRPPGPSGAPHAPRPGFDASSRVGDDEWTDSSSGPSASTISVRPPAPAAPIRPAPPVPAQVQFPIRS